MNVKTMADLELVKEFKGLGLKMDKTTRIARTAILTELTSRPLFREMCKEKGISYDEFVAKANLLSTLKR